MSYFSHFAELKIKIKAPHTHVEKDFLCSPIQWHKILIITPHIKLLTTAHFLITVPFAKFSLTLQRRQKKECCNLRVLCTTK